MAEYRVNLDIYNGPLDLLLYLIRRDEVDIHDIPVSRITEQYLRYVEMLQGINPDMAGEFLVLAATLLEIKTRMLLPPTAREEAQEGLTIDPRAELVRQLLQYKAFKDAAGLLEDAAERRASRFARTPVIPDADPTAVDLEDVQVWDLVEAFGKLLDSIGHRPTHHQVIYDDTPLELLQEDLLDRLRRDGPLRFSDVFQGRTRSEMVGLFLAMLELVRLHKVVASQEIAFGEIHVYVNANAAASSEVEPSAQAPAESSAKASADSPAEQTAEPVALPSVDASASPSGEAPVSASAEESAPGDSDVSDSLAISRTPGPEVAAAAPPVSREETAADVPSGDSAEPANREPAIPEAPPLPPPAQDLGQYVSQKPTTDQSESEDERGTEDQGTGV